VHYSFLFYELIG